MAATKSTVSSIEVSSSGITHFTYSINSTWTDVGVRVKHVSNSGTSRLQFSATDPQASSGAHLLSAGDSYDLPVSEWTGHLYLFSQAPSSGYTRSTVEITIFYTDYTPCGAPTNVTINGSASARSEGKAILSWSGATPGTNNPIASFLVQRSSDNITFENLASIPANVTVAQLEVDPPATRGAYYYYRIYTIGTVPEFSSAESARVVLIRNYLPSTPESLTISPLIRESGEITMTWEASTDQDGDNITYDLQYRIHNGTAWGDWTDCASTSDQTYSDDPDLPRGNQIQYRVRARDALGGVSEYAEFTSVTQNTLPAAPAGISVTPALRQSGSIGIAWMASTDSTDAVSGYLVEYRTKSYGSADWGPWSELVRINGLSYSHLPNLQAGDHMQFRVCAYDTFGARSDYAVSSEVVQNTPPSRVTNLQTNLRAYNDMPVWESGDVILSWNIPNDVDGNLDHFNITRQSSEDGVHWSAEISVTSVTRNTATVSIPATLLRGRQIRFNIQPVDALGAAGQTASVTIVRNVLPTTPSALSISPLVYETGNITASWMSSLDTTDEIAGYDLQYKTRSQNGEYGDYSDSERLTVNTFTKSPALSRGAWIRYRVRAVDALGACSDWAEFEEVQRNIGLDAPPGFTARPLLFENERITLTWETPDDPNSVLDHYELEYMVRNNPSTGWSNVVSVGTYDTTTATVAPPSISRGGYVLYRVRAVDVFGIYSPWSSIEVRRNSAPINPGHVQALPAIYEPGTDLTVTWDQAEDADNNVIAYDVAVIVSDRDAAFTYKESDIVVRRTTESSATVTITACSRGQVIHIGVRAVDAKHVTSPWSNANAVAVNQLPAVLQIVYPAFRPLTTRTHRPVFGFRAMPEPDGQKQLVRVTIWSMRGGTRSGTVMENELIGEVSAEGGILIWRCDTAMTEGDYQLQASVYDTQSSDAGYTVTFNFTVSLASWTRAIIRGTVICSTGDYYNEGVLVLGVSSVHGNCLEINGATVNEKRLIIRTTSGVSHQADLSELIRLVNGRRKWFGLDPVAYSTELGWYKHWLPQIQEAYVAICECYDLIHETPPTLVMPETNAPTAATINTVRTLVDNL